MVELPGLSRSRPAPELGRLRALVPGLAGGVRGDASDAITEYGRFVGSGVERPPESPFVGLKHGWILGSDSFVRRLKGRLPVGRPLGARRKPRRC